MPENMNRFQSSYVPLVTNVQDYFLLELVSPPSPSIVLMHFLPSEFSQLFNSLTNRFCLYTNRIVVILPRIPHQYRITNKFIVVNHVFTSS